MDEDVPPPPSMPPVPPPLSIINEEAPPSPPPPPPPVPDSVSIDSNAPPVLPSKPPPLAPVSSELMKEIANNKAAAPPLPPRRTSLFQVNESATAMSVMKDLDMDLDLDAMNLVNKKTSSVLVNNIRRIDQIQAYCGTQVIFDDYEYVILEDNLEKFDRWKRHEPRSFILTSKRILYGHYDEQPKDSGIGKEPRLNVHRVLPLSNVVAKLPIESYEIIPNQDTFMILSLDKSFHVMNTNKVIVNNNKWIDEINKAARDVQSKAGRIMNSDTIKMWDVRKNDSNIDVTRCYLCTSSFTFFMRRHHCRSCGHSVCHTCSNYRVMLEFDVTRKMRRVCRKCANEIKDNRQYGTGKAAESMEFADDDD